MPPAITGPGPLIAAPLATTPFTVSNSRFVSYSQMTDPSLVEYARMPPSRLPEKTAPGITVMAAGWAALQPRTVPHFGTAGGATHTDLPVSSETACRPPGFVLETS